MECKTKVSVIIPIYNVEKYLRKCLESVVNQTLEDIEIICINDCSPDNSLEIIKEYMEKDSRIKLIDFKENKGVAIARNTAMEMAQGEYIGFVDPDDWIDLDFYEKLYNNAKNENSELTIGNIKKVINLKFLNYSYDYNLFKKYKIFFGLFQLAIYKNELLKKYNIIFTPKCIYGEDRLLPIMSSCYANHITFVEDTFYYLYDRSDSATKNIGNKKIEDFISSTKLVIDFLNTADINNKKYNVITHIFLRSAFFLFKYTNNQSAKKLSDFILWLNKNIKEPNILTEIDLQIIDNIKACNIELAKKNIAYQNKKIIFNRLRKFHTNNIAEADYE